MLLFVCRVGRDRRFLRPRSTTAGPSPNPYAYTRVIITSPHFWHVTTLIPQGHIWAQGTPISKRPWSFSFPSTEKGRQHHLVFLFLGVLCLSPFFLLRSAAQTAAACREREKETCPERPKRHPSKYWPDPMLLNFSDLSVNVAIGHCRCCCCYWSGRGRNMSYIYPSTAGPHF